MFRLHKRQPLYFTLLLFPWCAFAQDGKRLREPPPDVRDAYAASCWACDSLADAYLQAGDTSMAIYYYQRFLDAHAEAWHKRSSVMKLRQYYYNRRQTFYLPDY